jgi:threonine synthase
LATNENNVLDEFFRTGVYRLRAAAEVQQTSSPSMDISKASNFERYVFDVLGRDAGRLRGLWQQLDARGMFALDGRAERDAVAASGFVSGASSHRDRIETIRHVHSTYGVTIDTHTADGFKVGLEHREAGVPLVCLETALPAKFAEAIREALGHEPKRPPGFDGLEALPQRFTLVDADAEQVKQVVRAHAQSAAGGA